MAADPGPSSAPPPPPGRALVLAGDALWLEPRGEVLAPPRGAAPAGGRVVALPGGPPALPLHLFPAPDADRSPPAGVRAVPLAEVLGGLHPLDPPDLPQRLARWVNTL